MGIQQNPWCPPESPHPWDEEFVDFNPDDWIFYNGKSGEGVVTIESDLPDAYDTSFSGTRSMRIISSPSHHPSWLLAQPGNNAQVFMGIKRTIPTNLLVVARMRSNVRYNTIVNGDCTAAVIMCEDSGGYPDYRDNRVGMFLVEADSNIFRAKYDHFNGGTFQGNATSDDDDQRGYKFEYVALHKIGTTYHGWVGSPAGNWMYMSAFTETLTMEWVGLFFQTKSLSAPGALIAGVDFIRFYETDNFLF